MIGMKHQVIPWDEILHARYNLQGYEAVRIRFVRAMNHQEWLEITYI